MSERVVVETECKHGFIGGHADKSVGVVVGGGYPFCPGGSRRVLTEGQYVLIEKEDGEWPKAAALLIVEAVVENTWGTIGGAVLDVLSDHTEGTP